MIHKLTDRTLNDVKFGIIQFRRTGMSLIEMLVGLGILSMLFSMLLPSIAHVREQARRISCANNCRQIALGSQNFEANMRKFPGSYLSQVPDGNIYHRDRGAFVSLLGYMDDAPLSGRFGIIPRTFTESNSNILALAPSFLKCPSGLKSASLTNLAPWFSGPNHVTIVKAEVPDYAICAGLSPMIKGSFELSKGMAAVHIEGVTGPRTAAEITDGLSNTIAGWESRGDSFVMPNGHKFSFDDNAPQNSTFRISETRSIIAQGPGSTKAWAYSWAGFASGTLYRFADSGQPISWDDKANYSRTINVSNIGSGPISLHPGGVNVWHADGAVKFLAQKIEPDVISSFATIAGERSE